MHGHEKQNGNGRNTRKGMGKQPLGRKKQENGVIVYERDKEKNKNSLVKRASASIFNRHMQEGRRKASVETGGDRHKASSREHGEQASAASV